MNEYRSSHVFDYENVHEIIFLCGNMSYILSISFSWYSKGLNFTNEIMFFNDDFVYLMILKTSKYSTYVVFALSHHGKCVSTKIPSITEERLSRDRRIDPQSTVIHLANQTRDLHWSSRTVYLFLGFVFMFYLGILKSPNTYYDCFFFTCINSLSQVLFALKSANLKTM